MLSFSFTTQFFYANIRHIHNVIIELLIFNIVIDNTCFYLSKWANQNHRKYFEGFRVVHCWKIPWTIYMWYKYVWCLLVHYFIFMILRVMWKCVKLIQYVWPWENYCLLKKTICNFLFLETSSIENISRKV